MNTVTEFGWIFSV